MITHRVTMKSYLRTMQIASLAALLTQCSRQSVPTVPGMNGDIDPTIVGVERQEVASAMAGLRRADRVNVIVFKDGKYYVNRPDLRNGPFYYKPTAVPNEFIDPSGRRVLFPPAEPRPAASSTRHGMDGGEGANTGIAYGHYSQSGNTYASAFVNIPCATTYLNDGGEVMLPPQTGYIYSGGEADDLGDEQTDFGFQLNAPSGGGVPTSIQPYTHTYSSNTQGAPTGDTRLHLICDTDYTLTFYVGTTSDGLPELVLNYVGSTTAIVTPQNYSIVQVMTSSTLWRTSCTACRVKRMTTIAVPPTSPTNTVLATWLGVSDPFNLTREGPTAQTQWRNAQVAATYESTPQSWVDGFVVGSDSKSRGLAVVKKYDAANEDVGINESGAHVVARVRKSQ